MQEADGDGWGHREVSHAEAATLTAVDHLLRRYEQHCLIHLQAIDAQTIKRLIYVERAYVRAGRTTGAHLQDRDDKCGQVVADAAGEENFHLLLPRLQPTRANDGGADQALRELVLVQE